MKTLAIACAVLVAGLVGSAKAGDVSKSTLNAMGFGSASIMSDNDGLAVRGKGVSASVFGRNSANYWDHTGNASSRNGYNASSSHHYGSSLAKGESNSFAGKEVAIGSFTKSTFYTSGGAAFAFAK